MESQGSDGARQESGQNEWHDIEYQGVTTKAPPCPDMTSTNASAAEKFVVSQRRRGPMGLDGRQAKARYCLREIGKGNVEIFGDSAKVNVGITELQERLEVPVQICISIQQVAQQARSENDQKVFEIFRQEEELCVASWTRWDAQWKCLVELERRCQD